MVGDGGGKAPAFARAVIGADNVARVLATCSRRWPPSRRPSSGARSTAIQVRFFDRSDQVGTMSLDVLGGRIQTIRSVANPDKLGHLGPADAWAVARAMKDSRRTGG